MADHVRVNVGGTRNVLDAAVGRRVVVARRRSRSGATTSRATCARTARRGPCGLPYIDTKGAAEVLALRRGATRRSGPATSTARAPRRGWCARSRLMRAGRFFLPAPGDGVITPVYVDDLVARSCVRCGSRARPGAPTRCGTASRSARSTSSPATRGCSDRGPLPAAAAAARRPARRPARAPEAADRPGALTFLTPGGVPEHARPRGARTGARRSISRRACAAPRRGRARRGCSRALRDRNLRHGDRHPATPRRRAADQLNRPDTMNAWDKQLGLDLLAALDYAREDDDVRAVTITGAGRALLVRRRPAAGLRSHAGGPSGRRDAAARGLPPDDHGPPPTAEAGAGRRQRARRSASAARWRWPAT